MQGTIRSYDWPTQEKIIERIETISHNIAKGFNCTAELDIERQYPATINHPTESEHIRRVATKWFGPEHVTEEDLPLAASEDFAYFLHKKPGSFFMLGTQKPGDKPGGLHTSDYNFNDDVLASGGYFWVRLIEDRLNVKIFK